MTHVSQFTIIEVKIIEGYADYIRSVQIILAALYIGLGNLLAERKRMGKREGGIKQAWEKGSLI